MFFVEIAFLLLVAGFCGSVARRIVGSRRLGCVPAIAVGFVGALLGKWIAQGLALPDYLTIRILDSTFPIVWSILGSIVLLVGLGLLRGGSRT